MKVKAYSWMMATAYVISGIALFNIINAFESIYSGINVPLPFLAKLILGIGPIGTLCVSMAIAAIVILKDLRFRSRFLNPIFTFLFVVWTFTACVVPLFPLCGRITTGIH